MSSTGELHYLSHLQELPFSAFLEPDMEAQGGLFHALDFLTSGLHERTNRGVQNFLKSKLHLQIYGQEEGDSEIQKCFS